VQNHFGITLGKSGWFPIIYLLKYKLMMNSKQLKLDKVSTLVEILRWRSENQPNSRAYTFLVDGEMQEIHLTYGELDLRARAIAAYLQTGGATGNSLGNRYHDGKTQSERFYAPRALLFYPPGLEYIAAFFGCLYAGIIPVPAYPPRANRSMSRLQAIVADAGATVALATSSILANAERYFAEAPDLKSLHWLATDIIDTDPAKAWQEPLLTRNSLAFLQYTSGSTGTPKGVMVSHGNLLHNLTLIYRCFGHTPHSQGVIWLPPYHDMGLVGGVLQALYGGCPVTLMSPMAFLQKPIRWLQAISRYKATTSGGPNFAYDLCTEKITPAQRETLDLSSWDLAFNGAEPIRAKTLEYFAATFASCGFRAEAFYPCYGMAEATLLVSGGLKTAPATYCTVSAAGLEQNSAIPGSVQDKEISRMLVSCGKSWLGQKIIIVDPNSLLLRPPGQIGEIWVASPSVAEGYWNKPEETAQTFQATLADTGEGPFLRTGDLGFLQDGELFVTGRLKDMIIVDGRNHYPQDIELTVAQSHPALKLAGAFSVDVASEERLVVVAEVERRYWSELDALVKGIRRAIATHHDLQVYAVQLLKPGSIPKTSSGKIQRHACRMGFLADNLEVVGELKPNPRTPPSLQAQGTSSNSTNISNPPSPSPDSV
jgi:acyl-CoA synthetase (AMP-forming)/AMP-acid ligase II